MIGITRRWLDLAGSNYLAIITLAVPGSLITQHFLRVETVSGFPPRMLVALGFVLLGAFLAICCAPRSNRSALWDAAAFTGIISWLLLVLIMKIGSSAVEYSVLILPILLVLTILKPVNLRSVNNAIAVLVIGTALIVAVSEIAGVLFGKPAWLAAYPVVGMRWNVSQMVFGLTTSWQGPFNWPADAGIAGGFLVAFGLATHSRLRWIALPVGAAMILASQRYTPLFGIVAALVVVLWFGRKGGIDSLAKPLRWGLATVLLIATILFFLIQDPTASGRNLWWSACTSLWLEHPFLGYQSIENGISVAEKFECSYAHALVLQLLAEFGLLGSVAVFTFIALGIFITWRAAKAGAVLGLTIVVAFLVMGLSETQGSWLYLNLPWAWFILGVLHAATTLQTQTAPLARPTSWSVDSRGKSLL